jgi:hypothetical protein
MAKLKSSLRKFYGRHHELVVPAVEISQTFLKKNTQKNAPEV